MLGARGGKTEQKENMDIPTRWLGGLVEAVAVGREKAGMVLCAHALPYHFHGQVPNKLRSGTRLKSRVGDPCS